MPRLSTRKIAKACGFDLPLSLENILHFGTTTKSLKEKLTWMQTKCMPWEVVQNSKKMAVHAALLPTGQHGEILYFGGYRVQDSHIFDVKNYTISEDFTHDPYWPEDNDDDVTVNTNIFCSGHAFLSHGTLLVAGGQLHLFTPNGQEIPPPAPPSEEDFDTPEEYLEAYQEWLEHNGPHAAHGGMGWGGSRVCWTYHPFERKWKRAASLNLDPAKNPNSGGRWYPTVITLFNGEVLAVAGHPDLRESYNARHNNNTPERYQLTTKSWVLMNAASTADNSERDEYPRIHQLPNGTVFFSTIVKGLNRFYEPLTGNFLESALIFPHQDSIYYQGSSATSILLPLLPNENYKSRVLICGAAIAWKINASDDGAQWESTDRDWGLISPVRAHLCATILPTGQIFISGGTQTDGSDQERQEGCVLQGEIYTPGIDWEKGSYQPTFNIDWMEKWKTVEAAAVKRHYHSVALLMPDGVVWTAGSNGDGSQKYVDASGNHLGETKIEVYRPPYTSEVHRPIITKSPERIIYGQTFEIRTPQAGNIQRVALIRNGSVTHAFNGDQRYVALTFDYIKDDLLIAKTPYWSGIAPPGYYMLWIIDKKERPCQLAKFVNLSALSVKTVAASWGIFPKISILGNIFSHGPSGTKSLKEKLLWMQKENFNKSIL